MTSTKNRSRIEVAPGVFADARRAVWLADSRTLAIADLHLGYAWAHRRHGQLLPVAHSGDTLARVEALLAAYPAAESLVLLGDIVHRSVPVPALREEVCALVGSVARRVALHLVTGNHDAGLRSLLDSWSVKHPLAVEHRVGDLLLVHGDTDAATDGRFVVMGHEHPTISLSDGVCTCARYPCFLAGNGILVLPAFSAWAAGADVSRGHFLSPLAARMRFAQAIAILGDRLLPLQI